MTQFWTYLHVLSIICYFLSGHMQGHILHPDLVHLNITTSRSTLSNLYPLVTIQYRGGYKEKTAERKLNPEDSNFTQPLTQAGAPVTPNTMCAWQ